MSDPNWGSLLASWWGGSYVNATNIGYSGSNLVVSGTNDPFYPSDFFALYPRFGGCPTELNGATTAGSTTVLVSSPLTGIKIGQVITGPNVLDGTTIAAVNTVTPASITLSQAAAADGTQLTFEVYVKPLVPLSVLTIFINLASSQLQQARWLEMWQVGMCLYIAHLATLWLQSEGNPTSAPGAAAQAGLAKGIAVSKAVDSVSVGYQALAGLDDLGDLQLTVYGQQLATKGQDRRTRNDLFVVSYTRTSRFDRVRDSLKQLSNTEVLVGIPAEDNQRKGEALNNAALLFLLTNGSEIQNIPPRPVIEPAIEHDKALIVVPLREAVQAAIQGKPFEDLLDKAGQLGENAAKRWFTSPDNHWAPNAPATIKAKGSDMPNIDEGEVRRAITHIVRTEGQEQ